MTVLHSSISHKGSFPYVYGLLGYPRLMSYERNVITVYRVEGREEFENDQFHSVIYQWIEDTDKSFRIENFIYGEHDRYGEIFARIRVNSVRRYNELREYLNQRYVGISYPGAGVLRAYGIGKMEIPDNETVIGGYKYRYGTRGFFLRDESNFVIAQAHEVDQSMEIFVDTYNKWDSKKYVDMNITGGKGLLESGNPRVEDKLSLVDGESVLIRMQDYEILQMVNHIYKSLRIQDTDHNTEANGNIHRHFTQQTP